MERPRTESAPSIAARAGRWSATHRKTAIWGWLAFVFASFAVGGAVGTKTLQQDELGVGESGRAAKAITAAFERETEELVLIQSETATASDPAFRAAVADVKSGLEQVPFVTGIESPYAEANAGQISIDRQSALVRFKIVGDDEQTQDRVEGALDAVAAAQRQNPDFLIAESGNASINSAILDAIGEDFQKALFTSLPITLLILLLAFGAVVAALVPLLLGLTAVIATIGLMGPISQISAVDTSVNEVILLIGLAVGVDYSMFYLRREREEREAGRTESAALAAAAATSGRAVMISGFTVMIAMAGMYLAGASTFQSFATGTILVVAVAVLGSLTVLPATLAWLGDRIEKGGVPIIKNQSWNAGEGNFWSRVLNPVLRHPVISVLLAGGLLVVLAIPSFRLHTANPGVSSLPQDLAVIKTYNRMQDAFPGRPIPAVVAVQADDVSSLEVQVAIADLTERAVANPHFSEPITTEASPDNTVAAVTVPLAGDGDNAQSKAALSILREDLIPATVEGVPGVTAEVTGYTADSEDFTEALKSHAPLVFGFVLVAAFILLLFTFRSLVIPLKAIVLNMLSVGAAYGILVWVFQDGHLESALGFESNGAIVSWMPIFLFVVLFGLSMDYHVFILTRIREAFDRGMPTDEAVAHGIKSTAGVVTSAAAVMISVFAIFATLSLVIFKQLGIGLAMAVLIDATIIRAVLLPATMKLLGDANWYLPSWLEWLPRVTHEPAVGGPEPQDVGSPSKGPPLEPPPPAAHPGS